MKKLLQRIGVSLLLAAFLVNTAFAATQVPAQLWKQESATSIKPANDRNVHIVGNLTLDGVFTFGGTVGTGGILFPDDIASEFGTSTDASLLYETADANANELLLSLPAGTATNVPVFVVGDDTALNLDLGLFNGITDPSIAVLSNDATKAVRIYHDGTTGYLASTSGGLKTTSAFTFSGNVFVDTQFIAMTTNKPIYFDSGGLQGVKNSTAQTPDALVVGVDGAGTYSRNLILAEKGDWDFDFAHANPTNPTFIVHSANQSTTEWISMSHDQTDGVIATGTGAVSITSKMKHTKALVGGDIGFTGTYATSGSAASQVIGQFSQLTAGFTGNAATNVLAFDNVVAGISTAYQTDGSYGSRPNGNRGVSGYARATTTGHNVGLLVGAVNGAVNWGTWSAATVALANKSNVGVIGLGFNDATGGEGIGVYALYANPATQPTITADIKTALYADNDGNAVDIAIFADNGSNVARIADGGSIVHSPVTLTSGGTNDYAMSIAQTLNDAGVAGGSDVYRGLKYTMTATDLTGWNNVYLWDFKTTAGAGGHLELVAGGTIGAFEVRESGGNSMGMYHDGTDGFFSNSLGEYIFKLASAELVRLGASGIFFDKDTTASITQDAATTDVATVDVIVEAQNAFQNAGANTNVIGGDLWLKGGSSNLLGTDAAKGGDIISAPGKKNGSTYSGGFAFYDNKTDLNKMMTVYGMNANTDTGFITAAHTQDVYFGYDTGAGFAYALQVQNVVSQANYAMISGSATGNAIPVDAAGSDTNIGFDFATKGTGAFTFSSDSGLDVVMNSQAATLHSGMRIGSGGGYTIASDASLGVTGFQVDPYTITLTGTNGATSVAGVSIGRTTVTSASANTVGAGASLYVDGPAIAAGSVTLSATYSVFVASGISRFGGDVDLSSDSGFVLNSTNASITASTTQTQGQGPLTKQINEVSTVANPNDTVTLPTAATGLCVFIINNGANTLQIFPASSDNLGAGVDTATTLASGSNVEYCAYNATNWEVK